VAAERSPPLPSGWFDWIRPFYAIDDTFVLNNSSVDGFFFLRYLKVLATICAAGLVVVWPVLLPLHGTGGRNLTQLELLTIGNVVSPSKFYAHAFVSWCFFGTSSPVPACFACASRKGSPSARLHPLHDIAGMRLLH